MLETFSTCGLLMEFIMTKPQWQMMFNTVSCRIDIILSKLNPKFRKTNSGNVNYVRE